MRNLSRRIPYRTPIEPLKKPREAFKDKPFLSRKSCMYLISIKKKSVNKWWILRDSLKKVTIGDSTNTDRADAQVNNQILSIAAHSKYSSSSQLIIEKDVVSKKLTAYFS